MGLLYVKTGDGKKKPSVWVWLFLLACFLIISYLIVTNPRTTGIESMGGKNPIKETKEEVIPIEKPESNKSLSNSNLDAEAINSIQKQVKREKEENGGYISPQRQNEIEEKYIKEYNKKQAANFKPTVDKRVADLEKPEEIKKTETKAKTKETQAIKNEEYLTFAQRLESEGIKTKAAPGGGSDFGKPSHLPGESTNKESTIVNNVQTSGSKNWKQASNILPLGTFIPCVLDGDVITTDLTDFVWANVVLDVTFRRQLQLPKGLVRVRGKTATTPVQDMVDIFFDTMVFSDGTELPISGYAYTAFDPRYPNKYKARAIPGEMIIPPAYLQIESLLLTAGLGASQAYMDNYVNQNTTTPSTFTTIPQINPQTGQVQNVIQQSQGQPVNNNIGATLGLSAAQSGLTALVKHLQENLKKYKPYVIVEKGTPFFIQLNTTVDVSTRKINGTALAQEELLVKNAKLRKEGITLPQETYAPEDARATYSAPASSTDNANAAAAQAGNNLLNQLQTESSSTASGSIPNNSGAQLQKILQGISNTQ